MNYAAVGAVNDTKLAEAILYTYREHATWCWPRLLRFPEARGRRWPDAGAVGRSRPGRSRRRGAGRRTGRRHRHCAGNRPDVTGTYPLKLNVAGVRAHRHTDDQSVFVDVRTAWKGGIGHGHMISRRLKPPRPC